jgi:hypothetical protein
MSDIEKLPPTKVLTKAGQDKDVFQLQFVYLASVPADGILVIGSSNNQHLILI